jgi:hypothetical protein
VPYRTGHPRQSAAHNIVVIAADTCFRKLRPNPTKGDFLFLIFFVKFTYRSNTSTVRPVVLGPVSERREQLKNQKINK